MLICFIPNQINFEARTLHGFSVPRNGATKASGISRARLLWPGTNRTRQVRTKQAARCGSQSCRSRIRALLRGVILNLQIEHAKFRVSSRWDGLCSISRLSFKYAFVGLHETLLDFHYQWHVIFNAECV